MPDGIAAPSPPALDTRTELAKLVHRACESALQTASSGSRADALRSVARTVNAVVQGAMMQLSRTLNDGAPINQLPRELFLQILTHVPLCDRIAVTHICQHWRTVAIGAPELWCEFDGALERKGGLDHVLAVLSRSGNAPLSLYLVVSGSYDSFGDLLRTHMGHMKFLDLRLDFEFARGEFTMLIQPLLRALMEPAPLLKDLRIQITRLPRIPAEDTYLPDALFAHSAPVLRSVILGGLAIYPRPYEAFSAVRMLRIAQLEVDFLRVIELHPRLEQLHVGTLRLVSSGNIVATHSLELLDVRGTAEAVEMVFTQLICTRPTRVWMDLVNESIIQLILAHSAKQTLRAVRVHIQFPILARCLELAYDGGMTWVLGATVETRIGELILRNEALMAGVTKLALHELQRPLQLETLVVPRLTLLEIVLDSFAEPSSSHMATSSDVLYSLQAAVALCQKLPSPYSRLVALRKGMSAIRTSGRRILRTVNDSAPTHRIPDDVLLHALCYCTSEDQASASRLLKNVNGREGRWMDLWFTDADGLTQAAASLTRFADVPISLTLVIHKDYGTLGDLLRHNLARIRKLCIQILPPFFSITQWANERPPVATVMMALKEPAPGLEDLDLWNSQRSWNVSEEIYLPEDLLAGSAPLLRSLNARGVALRGRPYPALAGIRNLALSQFEVNLPYILESFPNLEQLHIDAVSLSITRSDETTRTTPHHLHLLRIPGTKDAAEIVCTQLFPARPLRVWAEALEDDLLGYVLAHTLKTDVRSVRVYLDVHSMQPACVITYLSGISWVLGTWAFSPSLGLAFCDAEIIGSISELAVHELSWPRRPLELPLAARLTRLELVLYCFAFHTSDRQVDDLFSGIFCDDDDARSILHCPALEELSLFCPFLQPLVVDVFDVLGFISTSLRYTSAVLPLLSLRNVRLYDPAHGRGMELLTDRIRRVEYLDLMEPPIPYIHQKNTSMSWVYAMMG
ncbi:hypothetical protein AURDEDRAFT_123488 [Auricularia subglabra TFB-10046 SS5]|nr:hypothetical protein AURDEDRAFT_123488 [Auricularia subglabra TFB-10046 SS5]